MTYQLTLKDQVNAGPAQVSLILSWRAGLRMQLHDLIRERVLLEWDRRRDDANPDAPPLVAYAAARKEAAQDGEHRRQAGTSREDAVALALNGFRHNAFFVIVGDRQVTDLDAEITLTLNTEVTFVRLVPLVGG